MTQRELSEAAGVSIPAVSKSKKLPRIYDADGHRVFNENDPEVKSFIASNNENRKKARKEKSRSATAPRQPKPAPPPDDTDSSVTRPGRRKPAPEDAFTLDDKKTVEQIEKLRLENAETRGDLVAREDVKRIWVRIIAIHTSILQPLGAKQARDVARCLGITDPALILKAQESLDKETYSALTDIKKRLMAFVDETELER